jgi:hypothetical protein
MAYSDRNIVITPNIGQSSAEPIIRFTGGSASSSATVYARVLDAGTLSWEATAGQVATIADGLNGSIFAVNDISGIPSIEVFDTGIVQFAKYQGQVQLGNNTQSTTTGTGALQVLGGVGISGNLNIGGSFALSNNIGIGGAGNTYGITVATTTNVAGYFYDSVSLRNIAIQVGNSSYPLGVGFNSYNVNGTTYVGGVGYNGQLTLTDSNGFKFLVSSASQSAGAVASQINTLNVSSSQIVVPISTVASSTSTGAITTYGGISSGGAHYAGLDSYFNGVRIGQGNLALATSNTVVGASAGGGLTTGGTNNTIMGNLAGNGVTTGGNNSLFGYNAGNALGAGAGNTAIGQATLALAGGASASNNTAVGYRAMGVGSLLTGNNTAVGTNALQLLASGANNTALGYNAGGAITGNSGNVLVGYNAGNALSYDNCVVLGSYAGAAFTAAGQIAIASGGAGTGTLRIFIDENGKTTIQSSTAASTTNTAGALYTTGGASIQGGLNLGGALYAQNSAGTNGYFLQTTGSGVQWAQAGVTVSNITTAGTYYPTFTNSVSGTLNTVNVDSTFLVFDPSTGKLSTTGNINGGATGYMFAGQAGFGVGTTNAVGTGGAVLQIGYKDASTNLLRIGDGSGTANSSYRWRVDQTYNWIANNGTADTFSVASTGAVTTPGQVTITNSAGSCLYINNSANGGDLTIRNTYPTIHFRDTDGFNAYLHNNSNLLYVLRAGNDAGDGSWVQVNSQWPFIFNLSDNSATCGGTFYAVGDVYSATSDERLKDIEGPITDAVAKVMQLEGFYYYDNELAKSLGVVSDRRKLGLSAQKLQATIPEVVVPAPFDLEEKTGESKSGENYLTAQYERVVPLLVEAIKEHEHTIQAQQVQIDELKALVTQLLNK